MNTKERYRAFVNHFTHSLPNPTTELLYNTPFELLVAVILSAQCTDKRVNQVTPELFKAFPTPAQLAAATPSIVQHYIKQISYPNSKAKYLVGMAKMLVEDFGGVVPDNVSALQKMPGVGRKTAHVVIATIYKKPLMAVDTHVMRVSKRLGLVSEQATTPLAIEQALVAKLEKKHLPYAHHWLVLHGRYTCLARKPKCNTCPLTHFCRYYASK